MWNKILFTLLGLLIMAVPVGLMTLLAKHPELAKNIFLVVAAVILIGLAYNLGKLVEESNAYRWWRRKYAKSRME
ncbi:hypothetical protein [Metabacillus sp. 84]|uniref:hypothetical protein n=1 Tax=Metabacillus sp. 84 TaxID=3404705 RepID=UPI003CE7E57D